MPASYERNLEFSLRKVSRLAWLAVPRSPQRFRILLHAWDRGRRSVLFFQKFVEHQSSSQRSLEYLCFRSYSSSWQLAESFEIRGGRLQAPEDLTLPLVLHLVQQSLQFRLTLISLFLNGFCPCSEQLRVVLRPGHCWRLGIHLLGVTLISFFSFFFRQGSTFHVQEFV